jgi:hypothetical protein
VRTKSGRWTNARGPFTYSTNMELAGITADFAGGFVYIDAVALEVNPGSSNWVSLQATVDGVPQGQGRIIWQAAGQSNVQVGVTHSIRVPHGRHHIGAILSSSNGGVWGGNGGFIEVTEPPT